MTITSDSTLVSTVGADIRIQDGLGWEKRLLKTLRRIWLRTEKNERSFGAHMMG